MQNDENIAIDQQGNISNCPSFSKSESYYHNRGTRVINHVTLFAFHKIFRAD